MQTEPQISDERVVKTSIKVDIIDVLLNAAVALITGSMVMLAETLQGISDLIVDGLTYIGMKRSKQLPTEKHPLGFGRELYIWSLFATLVMFLFLTGLTLYFGFQRFINPEPVDYIFLAYLVLIISLFTNGYSFSLAFRRILQGRPFWRIKQAFSQSTFLETKITFVSDLLGTTAAIFGLSALILYRITGSSRFDGLGAIAIGFLMAFFSFWLLKHVRDFIIGVSASEETKKQIKKAALEIEGVRDVLDLKAMVIGSNRLLVNLEVHMAPGLMTEEIEKIIDKIKDNIRGKVPSAYHIQVEIETPSLR